MRFTDLFVTVNSNRAPRTLEEEDYLLNGWLALLQNEVWTAAGMQELVCWRDGAAGEVQSVEIVEPVIEMGPNKRRVHAHFTMILQHTGKVSLSSMLTKWHQYLNALAVPLLSNGVNVQFQLLDSSKVKNYNLKEAEAQPSDMPNLPTHVAF